MAITKGWSFDRSSGFTGSADSGKTPVRAHERSVTGFAKGGKVEGKSSTPPPRPQKHYDRMENFRKERSAEPAPPADNQKKMKRGGKACYAEGGKVANDVTRALVKNATLGIPGGDGTKNVVGFKKGGKAKARSAPKASAKTQEKAAGALAQIAEAAQASGGPSMGAQLGGPPAPMGIPGMKRGGKTGKPQKKK